MRLLLCAIAATLALGCSKQRRECEELSNVVLLSEQRLGQRIEGLAPSDPKILTYWGMRADEVRAVPVSDKELAPLKDDFLNASAVHLEALRGWQEAARHASEAHDSDPKADEKVEAAAASTRRRRSGLDAATGMILITCKR